MHALFRGEKKERDGCKLLKEEEYMAQGLYVGCTRWWRRALAGIETNSYVGAEKGATMADKAREID